jgi:hypothetical protein
MFNRFYLELQITLSLLAGAGIQGLQNGRVPI